MQRHTCNVVFRGNYTNGPCRLLLFSIYLDSVLYLAQCVLKPCGLWPKADNIVLGQPECDRMVSELSPARSVWIETQCEDALPEEWVTMMTRTFGASPRRQGAQDMVEIPHHQGKVK